MGPFLGGGREGGMGQGEGVPVGRMACGWGRSWDPAVNVRFKTHPWAPIQAAVGL